MSQSEPARGQDGAEHELATGPEAGHEPGADQRRRQGGQPGGQVGKAAAQRAVTVDLLDVQGQEEVEAEQRHPDGHARWRWPPTGSGARKIPSGTSGWAATRASMTKNAASSAAPSPEGHERLGRAPGMGIGADDAVDEHGQPCRHGQCARQVQGAAGARRPSTR